jgi:flagellar biosynthesis protein FlhA
MASAILNNRLFLWVQTNRGMIFPFTVTGLILVILVPLPTSLMDLLLSVNITVGAVVLLNTVYLTSPLEFSVFPSLLLATTMMRLVLNVATTRLILTAGDRAQTASAAASSAGRVIETFGNFVAGDSLAVGLIIFIILVVIQFVVITKGATRISEVAARFTLDAMPGKQMAIDADLNAGLINESQARQRREAISRESDFYGAMDGASKFVRGDAIAGIIIILVNVLGGLYVGMVEFGWSLTQCLATFTRLTIGDGLVSQIPAFLISLSAGLIVTRSTGKSDLGEDLLQQLTGQPRALLMAAVFLGILALTPLPKLPLFVLGASCAGLGLLVSRSNSEVATAASAAEKVKAHQQAEPQQVESLLAVDPMELEVGFGLIKLVDKRQGGDLLERINMIRKQLAVELGVILPPIRIRDQVRLASDEYSIKIKGVEVAGAQCKVDQFLAIDSGAVLQKIPGEEATEPAFGLPAVWIEQESKDLAERNNYTVVDPTGVVSTHLTEVIKRNAADLLSREDTNKLIENLRQRSPKLIEELVPEQVKPGLLQRVLQGLLRERVAVRDLESILETLGDWIGKTQDEDVLIEYVRNALSRQICAQQKDEHDTIWCVTLASELEDLINANIERNERGGFLKMPPQTSQKIVDAIAAEIQRASASAKAPPVVLCSPQIRAWLRRIIQPSLPHVPVLSYNEIVREVKVQSCAMVVIEQ